MANRIDRLPRTELDDILRQLETIIDRIGLSSTLSLMETIADMKAEAIATDWQDARNPPASAIAWEADARILEAASASVTDAPPATRR